MIARNTNHICKSMPPSMTRDQIRLSMLDDYPEQHVFENQTCNGGFLAHVCRGFRPGPNIDDIQIPEPEHFDPVSLGKRSLAS